MAVNMTLRHFQIFKAVCDCGGITAAGERLNITQPSVSIAIKELENFYSVKLLDRINRKIYLTEDGETLRRYADVVLEQCDEAAAILKNRRAASRCRLGVNVSFAESRLSGLYRCIKDAMPEISLHISVGNNEQLDGMLTDNRIDFAIYDGIGEKSSKTLLHLFKEKMVLLCSPEQAVSEKITMRELAERPLLQREKGSGVRRCVDRAFQAAGLAEQTVMESTSTESLLALAECGLGFVFVPESLAERMCLRRALASVELADFEIYRTYYLAYNEKKHMTGTMYRLKEIITHRNG